jgi:hypothetical protein
MPLYFFHLHGSDAHDIEGQNFPSDAAAREEAKAVARDLTRNRIAVLAESLIVRNADGEIVHEEPMQVSR